MNQHNQMMAINNIQNYIYSIRGIQVMLDKDLAELYQVETRILNQAVKRNIERFPEKFRFQLTQSEFDEHEKSLTSQIGMSKENRGGRRYLPYAFTEQGISMLSAVLRSETAIQISILIIDAFVEMRRFIANNATIFQRLTRVEQKQLEAEQKFGQIFQALDDKSIKPKQGIFFDGQIFDAYVFVADLIKSAQVSIILVDNYLDDSVITMLTKKQKNVNVFILTKQVSKQLQLDIKKANSQYPKFTAVEFGKAHDRFIIIDEEDVYHIGASLKDLGKKWFAFSKMDKDSVSILNAAEKLIKH